MTKAPTQRTFAATLQDGSVVFLTVRKPSRAELRSADLQYAATFNDAIKAGIPTSARQLRILAESGAWTTKEDEILEDRRIKALRAERELRAAIESKAPEEKIRELSNIQIALSTAFRVLLNERDGMLSQTAESRAGIEQRNFLLACVTEYAMLNDKGEAVNQDKVVVHSDGTKTPGRVWPDLDHLLDESDQDLLERALYEYSMFVSGLPSRWEESTQPATTAASTPDAVAAPANPPEPPAEQPPSPPEAVAATA